MPSYQIGKGQDIPFRDFAPDLSPDTPGIVLDANNVVPTMKGYAARNFPVVVPNTFLFNAGPPGAYIANVFGVPTLFTAAAGFIWQLESGGWVNVTGSVIVPPTTRFRFTQFGNDVIVTANSPIMTPLVWSPSSPLFVPLAGSPPLGATTVISVGGFVVFFAGANWYSSAAGVDNDYVPNIQTLAASGTLYDVPGDILAAASLYRSIIAFKAGAVWVGTFSGAPFTWSFQLISGQVGTYGQECVVTLPDSIAFLGTDDFYITTGYTPQRIPNSIKEWFFQNANPSQLMNVCGWYDHDNSIIYWHFVSTSSPGPGILDRYVSFNVRVGRWSTGYLNTTYVVPNTSDPSAPVTGANGGTSEGGYFFDTNSFLETWDSAAGAVPGTGYVKTGFLGDQDNLSQLLRFRAKWNVYPTIDFAQAFHTDILGQPPSFDAAVFKTADDWSSVRQYDRYHQVQFNFVGPAEIVGYTYEARVGGIR
jgi:hypothetical protein